ncbi:MAG: CHASE4 domain-containing protein [Planctomycetota bacterium]
MSIRSKVSWFTVGVSATLAVTTYLVQHFIMLPGFVQVERNEALDDVTRCVHALERDAEFLSYSANDYGAWDDTYQFIEDRNEEYVKENLIPETYQNMKLDVFLFVRKDGALVWGKVRGDDGKELVDAPDLFAEIARAEHVLVNHANPDSKKHGVLTTIRGPMIVGSAAITTSNREGEVRGAVITGRFITDETVEELSQRTRVSLQLFPVESIPETDRYAVSHLADGGTWMDPQDPDTLRSFQFVKDIHALPAMLLRADLPRSISQRGRAAAGLAAGTGIVGGAALMAVMWVVLARMIIRPLTRVTEHAVRVGADYDLRARLNMQESDEIGILATEFDRMVDRLAQSQRQLLDVAHHAGRAEVATNVLHNVGNVLNGVNVSAQIVSDKVRNSEANTLTQAARVLNEHQNDLGEFLTKNDQGRQFPGFLTELAAQVTREQETVLREMHSLTAAIEHIRNVIDSQQQHSQYGALLEPVEPAELVRQTVELSAESLKRHGIDVQQELEPMEAIPLDRHRILQVLVNLFTNAVNSVKQGSRDGRRITLKVSRLRETDRGGVCFRIEDNGVGIAPENLDRIFALGFTTRNDGHGIGLHGAANMAREMGGSLTARSGGLGCGAVFTLTIPVTGAESPSDSVRAARSDERVLPAGLTSEVPDARVV